MLDIVTDGNVSQSAHGLKVARHHFIKRPAIGTCSFSQCKESVHAQIIYY